MAATLDTLLRGRKKVPLRILAASRDTAERGPVDFSTTFRSSPAIFLKVRRNPAPRQTRPLHRARDITALFGPSGCG
jgi:hypothetical protein